MRRIYFRSRRAAKYQAKSGRCGALKLLTSLRSARMYGNTTCCSADGVYQHVFSGFKGVPGAVFEAALRRNPRRGRTRIRPNTIQVSPPESHCQVKVRPSFY